MQHPSTTRVLELLHMDLMGPMKVESLGGKRNAFVCVDDISRFSWVQFLREKYDTFNSFKVLFVKLMLEKNNALKNAVRIRSDQGKEFENSHLNIG